MVYVGDDQVTARPENSRGFREYGLKICHMGEGEPVDDQICRVVREWQSVKVADHKGSIGQTFARPAQHLVGVVNPDDAVLTLDQARGEPTGPARTVDGCADWKLIEDQVDDGLVEVEETIARVVVAGRPLLVRGVRCVALHKDTRVCRKHRIVEQILHFHQSRRDEVLVVVVVTGPSSQQRESLHPDQVRQGMLIDHQRDARPAVRDPAIDLLDSIQPARVRTSLGPTTSLLPDPAIPQGRLWLERR